MFLWQSKPRLFINSTILPLQLLTWSRLLKTNWWHSVKWLSSGLWKQEKKDIRKSERLIKRKTERQSESDIEKGRARYRAAKRRMASLETESYTNKGLTETEWVCVKQRKCLWGSDLCFIFFSPNCVWKVRLRAFFFFFFSFFLTFCSFVNHILQVVQKNFSQNHRLTRSMLSSLKVWHWKTKQKNKYF